MRCGASVPRSIVFERVRIPRRFPPAAVYLRFDAWEAVAWSRPTINHGSRTDEAFARWAAAFGVQPGHCVELAIWRRDDPEAGATLVITGARFATPAAALQFGALRARRVVSLLARDEARGRALLNRAAVKARRQRGAAAHERDTA